MFTQWKRCQLLGTHFVLLLLFTWKVFKDHLAHNSLSYVTESSGTLKLLYRNKCQSFCRWFFLSALRLAWLAGADASASRPAHIKGATPRSRRALAGAGVTRAAAFLLPPPPQKSSFPVGMGSSRGCEWTRPPCPAVPGGGGLGAARTPTCALGVGSPAAPRGDVAEASGGFCGAVGRCARRLEKQLRGFAPSFTGSWIQPLIPLPAPSLLSAIKPRVSLKVNY